jgi:predicted GIY-YIG superfamily endonuclease
MAPKHKIVVWNPKCRYTIYKMIHHKTKNPIYVGQTGNTSRRKAGYRATVKAELKKSEKIKTLILVSKLSLSSRVCQATTFPAAGRVAERTIANSL